MADEPFALGSRQEGMYFRAYLWYLAGAREKPDPETWALRTAPEQAMLIRRHAHKLAKALRVARTLPSDPGDTVKP